MPTKYTSGSRPSHGAELMPPSAESIHRRRLAVSAWRAGVAALPIHRLWTGRLPLGIPSREVNTHKERVVEQVVRAQKVNVGSQLLEDGLASAGPHVERPAQVEVFADGVRVVSVVDGALGGEYVGHHHEVQVALSRQGDSVEAQVAREQRVGLRLDLRQVRAQQVAERRRLAFVNRLDQVEAVGREVEEGARLALGEVLRERAQRADQKMPEDLLGSQRQRVVLLGHPEERAQPAEDERCVVLESHRAGRHSATGGLRRQRELVHLQQVPVQLPREGGRRRRLSRRRRARINLCAAVGVVAAHSAPAARPRPRRIKLGHGLLGDGFVDRRQRDAHAEHHMHHELPTALCAAGSDASAGRVRRAGLPATSRPSRARPADGRPAAASPLAPDSPASTRSPCGRCRAGQTARRRCSGRRRPNSGYGRRTRPSS
eukprot:scaffold5955_cov103-Isochrysis_galbana.AAC.1